MAALGTLALGKGALGGNVARSTPSISIITPGSLVTGEMVTVTWSFFSQLGRPQKTWRVILRRPDGTLLFNTPTNTGTTTSFLVPFLLQPFSSYRVRVEASDGLDTGTQFVDFSTQAFGEPTFPDNVEVGSVYDVAINGVGLVLADSPQNPERRQVGQIQPERLSTTETPFSENVDRYAYLTFRDWSGGEGQLHFDKPTSDPTRYWYSEGVDPFTVRGEIRPLKAMANKISTSYTDIRLAVAGDDLYALTSATQLTRRTTSISGSNTAFLHGADPALDLTSDGVNWYVTDGVDIWRNSTAATGSVWSTVDVTEIAWIGDRLAGLDTAAASPNFTTFDSAGAEEVVGGRFAFPGATLRGIAGGDGFVWFGVNRTSSSTVHAWQIGSAAGAFIALTLPLNEAVTGLFFYLGNVFVATRPGVENRSKIYRCVPNEGRLTPELIAETSAQTRVTFAGADRFVAFTWPTMTSTSASGIGVVDLETGGYARWVSTGVNAAVNGVAAWEGHFVASISGSGVFIRADSGVWVAGHLITSSSSLSSVTVKTVDEVQTATLPLLNIATVGVKLSTDTNATHQLVGTQSGEGSVGATFRPVVAGRDIAVRIDVTPESSGANASPRVKILSVKLHPYSLSDELVTLPIACFDYVAGLNGETIPDQGNGRGRARFRFLKQLCGVNVKLQDTDWPDTLSSNIYQVVSVEFAPVAVADGEAAIRRDGGIAVVTFRRQL